MVDAQLTGSQLQLLKDLKVLQDNGLVEDGQSYHYISSIDEEVFHPPLLTSWGEDRLKKEAKHGDR